MITIKKGSRMKHMSITVFFVLFTLFTVSFGWSEDNQRVSSIYPMSDNQFELRLAGKNDKFVVSRDVVGSDQYEKIFAIAMMALKNKSSMTVWFNGYWSNSTFYVTNFSIWG